MRAHVEAVADLRSLHRSETGHGQLAWRALFDGQGIYWTIKNYTGHRRSVATDLGKSLPPTDVEKADEAIRTWVSKEFEPTRAKNIGERQKLKSYLLINLAVQTDLLIFFGQWLFKSAF